VRLNACRLRWVRSNCSATSWANIRHQALFQLSHRPHNRPQSRYEALQHNDFNQDFNQLAFHIVHVVRVTGLYLRLQLAQDDMGGGHSEKHSKRVLELATKEAFVPLTMKKHEHPIALSHSRIDVNGRTIR
jgi:hypothetical protein